MSVVVIVGTQWGDEGKGRVTDNLAHHADLVVRYQGGTNTGHTVVLGEEVYRLHLVPAGIFYPGKICCMGAGTVIDPPVIVGEIDDLVRRGNDVSGLRLSGNAHLIMPYHRLQDVEEDKARGRLAIGTTKGGVGPAYADKHARMGIRLWDLSDRDRFRRRLREVLPFKNKMLTALYGLEPLKEEAILAELEPCIEPLRPFVVEVAEIVSQAVADGKNVLFEGAQGTFLDVDSGTYPYLTSSHPVAGGACLGTGVGPTMIHRVLGVAKAYTTRVGAGVFPTEQDNESGAAIRDRGHEYGTTTGRPRRCGWLDAVVLRTAARLNGLDSVAVTRLDVLDALDNILISTHYDVDGKRVEFFPSDAELVARCQPVYEEHQGWCTDTSTARTWEALPPLAQSYVSRIAELAGAKLAMVSVGRQRDAAIVLDAMF